MTVLFFSRGRGHGHAIPDMAIIAELRKADPGMGISIASYATGLRTFRAAGHQVIDLGLPENNGFIETQSICYKLIIREKPDIVVAHEEFAALTAAALAGVPSIFISAWLPQSKSIAAEALVLAGSIVVIEHPGVFAVPPGVGAPVHHVGPIIRKMKFTVQDRSALRQQLGLAPHALAILVVSGGWAMEERAPIVETILAAFQLLPDANKRLIWLAGRDSPALRQRMNNAPGIAIMDFYDPIEQLIAPCDVVITKGTRGITLDAAAVGVPTISLSSGLNPIDDTLVPRIRNNTALNARAVTGPILADYIEKLKAAPPAEFATSMTVASNGATLAAKTIYAEVRRLAG
jgi:UDP-N-acetylglucosamine:LPS N-acetylglucosamine transferase